MDLDGCPTCGGVGIVNGQPCGTCRGGGGFRALWARVTQYLMR